MDYEPIYHASRNENDALQPVRGRIHYDSRFSPQPYARAFTDKHGPYDAPMEPLPLKLRRVYLALFAIFVLLVFAGMGLLMVMDQAGR